MPTKRSSFQTTALASELVTPEVYSELSNALGVDLGELEDQEQAGRLVAAGYLTPYQAEQILLGRTKFRLGPYVVTNFLGAGGMGQVFLAQHGVMGRECAVKVLPKFKQTPEAIANFNREIRTQGQLDHPNLVRALDAGYDHGAHYLVTEYVAGLDLRKLVRNQGTLTISQAAYVARCAAEGLDYAHQRGLVHRDVKPGNILVTPEGVVKVSDLGLAGYIHEAGDDPRAGKIVGTADYLPPETIRSPNDKSPVGDIYSLGCTLYYMICGKVPFPGGSARDKARRHAEEMPWHPRRFNADISEEFVEIVADMMEKNPAERIQTMAEVVERLEPFAMVSGTIPSKQRLGKSSWTPPPPPGTREDELPDGHESEEHSGAQSSAGTHPVSIADTRDGTTAPAKAKPRGDRSTSIVLWTLAVSVPISMLAGALLAALVFWLIR